MGRFAIVVAALFVVITGCSGPGNPAHCHAGAEGCACVSGDSCDTGLVCQSGTCVSQGGADGGHGFDAGPPHDGGHHTVEPPDAGTAYCGPDGGGGSMTPGACTGEPVPGCPCETLGATDTCMNGRTITCTGSSEFPTWSACTGSCFSSGTWHLDNLTPCFVTDPSSGTVYAFSSWMDGTILSCGGPYTTDMLPTTPTEVWSADQLQVDCQGSFTLCYTIRANGSTPSDSECTLAQVCTSGYYADPNVMQTLDPLGPWLSSDSDCAQQFLDNGGYGEMSVVGVTIDCQNIGGTDSPFVFNHIPYCPPCCGDSAGCSNGFDCSTCSNGGSGSFGH